jgi:hypothetical protein
MSVSQKPQNFDGDISIIKKDEDVCEENFEDISDFILASELQDS